MIYHIDSQHFSSPSGTLFIEFFSLYGLYWAGHPRNTCTQKLLTVTSTRWFCRIIPSFAELEIEPISSVLGTFVDNTWIPLRYHRDGSSFVVRYYQQTVPTASYNLGGIWYSWSYPRIQHCWCARIVSYLDGLPLMEIPDKRYYSNPIEYFVQGVPLGHSLLAMK